VRDCPAKAIKVEQGQAIIIEERCIACGNCVKVCAQKAKKIKDSTVDVKRILEEKDNVFACLAPAFPAAFDDVAPGRVITAVRALGFSQVWDVAFGAELVSNEYVKLLERTDHSDRRFITTPCPAIVSYILKYMPSLKPMLAPVVSPMIAVGRVIREKVDRNAGIVFIGPCVAKKEEITDGCVEGIIDHVLTFNELVEMLDEKGIHIDEMEESNFDGAQSHLGRSFPLSGGLLRTSGLKADILENDIVVTSGKEHILSALNELNDGHSHARFFDVLFCEGCISGPFMLNTKSVLRRKEILTHYIKEQNRYITPREFREGLARYGDVSMQREFVAKPVTLRQPTEEEIDATLKSIGKFRPEDRLNCGSCGYATCREKAIAVCQGLAEAEMCLPYLLDEVEESFSQLQLSHDKLQAAQKLLVQSEKLASMGQLSAGIAHEINNPLGTILLYSHFLMDQLKGDTSTCEDIEMIANEATRCRDIVRGLLNFARKTQVTKKEIDFRELIADVIRLTSPKAGLARVRLSSDIQEELPPVMMDGPQITQMLVNLVDNGIDAIRGSGAVTVSVRTLPREDSIMIEVSDNGCGIAGENMGKLFTPFFTTKKVGKGTGLGLAMAYGIVKMHSGDIRVRSETGRGTTFTVTLPVTQTKEGEAQGESDLFGNGIITGGQADTSIDRGNRNREKIS